MEAKDFYDSLFRSEIFTKWHWFQYHFSKVKAGINNDFAESFISCCLHCEEIIPGFAELWINNIASISGLIRFVPHYEQLLQRLAEFHILNQVINFPWQENPKFILEPTEGNSKKNPEIEIRTDSFRCGIEVKSPAFNALLDSRKYKGIQLTSRMIPKQEIQAFAKDFPYQIMLPRDNLVKDYLISANQKFSSFIIKDKNFISLLVIVWDDFINEPISTLLSPMSGLLTKRSFYVDKADKAIIFENIDAIILVRYVNQLLHATRDEPFDDSCRFTFDYGEKDLFPFKVIIPISDIEIPLQIIDCLQCVPLSKNLGAEYNINDLILWI